MMLFRPAPAFDMVPTKAVVEKRAKKLKYSGVFAMGKDGMACQNFDVDQKVVSREK